MKGMATRSRRGDALSKTRIVDAAIEILDREGADALTFRALATHLSTGSGAIYHHVSNKDELLTEATDVIVARALAEVDRSLDARNALRSIGFGVYDAIHTHRWVGTQLTGTMLQTPSMRILESIGTALDRMGVPEYEQFDSATALMSYVLGLATQYAAAAKVLAPGTDRRQHLTLEADRLRELDPAEFPFVRRIALLLPQHDDREQFMAGFELILAGISTRT